jgi:hypothetical protein
MLTRLALYTTLGLVCWALGHEWTTPEFWCILGLFWAADRLGLEAGKQQGAMEGISAYIRMNTQEQEHIRGLVRDWEKLNG